MWRSLTLILIFFAGCTIPAEIYFRNLSPNSVRLQASLVDRRRFDKLPNRVNFYDTSTKKRQFYGEWRTDALVTWVDTSTFYIDVPAYTVVDLADISRGLTLGAKQPDVILSMIVNNKTDTLTTGDYSSIVAKFKLRGYGLFKPPVYYYDNH